MYAILSIVDSKTARIANEIRTAVSSTCKISSDIYGIEPHLSWQAAKDYPAGFVEEQLEKISKNLPPLELSIGGIGVFTGNRPVVYLSVTRSPAVEFYHNQIWGAVSGSGKEINQYFSPEHWIPHISLFYIGKDETMDLPCALAKLVRSEFQFQATINQISLAFDENDKFGIQSTFEFNREIKGLIGF